MRVQPELLARLIVNYDIPVQACSSQYTRCSAARSVMATYVGAEAAAVPAVSPVLLISAVADENYACCRAISPSRPV